jgi:hypothetical protein
VRCPDAALPRDGAVIDEAGSRGFSRRSCVDAEGIPGLGSHTQWDLRIEGRIAAALMALPGVKGVENGLGFAAAARPGSQVHDAIYRAKGKPWGWYRKSNRAGGIGRDHQRRDGHLPDRDEADPDAEEAARQRQPARRPRASGGARRRLRRAGLGSSPRRAGAGAGGALREKLGGDSIREMREHWQAFAKRIDVAR